MDKRLQFNNVDIFYRVEGEGLPVVLLHGLPLDGTAWDEQIEYLKPYCKLIIPDTPGSGKSIFQKTVPDAATIEFYAICLRALLLHENVGQCIMLGHSMGGYITLSFAENYPELLKGFGLIHSTAFADSDERKEIRRRGIAMMEEYGSYAFLKNTTPNLFGKEFKEARPEKIAALIENGRNFQKQVLQDYYRAMLRRPDRTIVLRNCKVPVLFVMGAEDAAAPLKDVLQQVWLPKIAYIHILETAAHVGMWESTTEMNTALLEFIRSFI